MFIFFLYSYWFAKFSSREIFPSVRKAQKLKSCWRFLLNFSKILISGFSARKTFRNRESFLPRNFLLAKFFYFKVIKTNLKRKLDQHKSRDNKPIWNYHDKTCLWSDCFCFANEISKVWYFIESFTKKK